MMTTFRTPIRSTPATPPPPPPPLDRGRAANGRLRRTLTALASSSFALLAAAPAFPQSAAFTHPEAWINEIDFNTGKVEVRVGPSTAPINTLKLCFYSFPNVCVNSNSNWTANSYIQFTVPNHTQYDWSSFAIHRSDDTILSFVQWGAANQTKSADAVAAGVWSNSNDFIARVTTAGRSQQYANPHNVIPSSAVWFSDPATNGSVNTPVELASFTAQGVAAGVLLKWQTESETANSGFQILRNNNKNDPFLSIHNDLIPGHGSTPHPNNYQYTDITAKPGTKYHYKLQDVAHDGKTQLSQTITARAGTPAP